MTLSNVLNRANQNVWFTAICYIILLLLGKLSATEFVIVYALETIIIGLFHVFKMIIVALRSNNSYSERANGLGLTLFFIVHYGMFVFIQTTFFFVFLSMGDARISDSIGFKNFATVFGFEGVQIALVLIVTTYVLKLYFNFLKPKRYKTIDSNLYMFQPYLRIFIQQFVAIIPGFFIVFGNVGVSVAIILILIRTIFDLYLAKLKNNQKIFDRVVAQFLKNYNKPHDKEAEELKVKAFLNMIIED